MFSITWYSFQWVIIPPCFPPSVAYGAWNSSMSARVQWKRFRRHLSQVITHTLCALSSHRGGIFIPQVFTILRLGFPSSTSVTSSYLCNTSKGFLNTLQKQKHLLRQRESLWDLWCVPIKITFYQSTWTDLSGFLSLQPTLESLGDSPHRHTAQQSSEYLSESTSKYVLEKKIQRWTI